MSPSRPFFRRFFPFILAAAASFRAGPGWSQGAQDFPADNYYHSQCGEDGSKFLHPASGQDAFNGAMQQYCDTFQAFDHSFHDMKQMMGDGSMSPTQALDMIKEHRQLRHDTEIKAQALEPKLTQAASLPGLSADDRGIASQAEGTIGPTLQFAQDEMTSHRNAIFKSRFNSPNPQAYPSWQQMALNPGDPNEAAAMAQALLAQNQAAAAAAAAREALALDPNNKSAVVTLGAANIATKDYPGALQAADRALSVDPSDDKAKAIHEYAYQAMQGTGQAPSVQDPFGAGREAGATALGGAAPSAAPGQVYGNTPAERLARDAASRLTVGDITGALKAADASIAADPNDPAGWATKAAIENQKGDFAAAEKDASKALALDPKDARALNARAYAENRLGKAEEALKDAETAAALNPKDAYAQVNRGLALDQLGRRAEALRAMKAAAQLNPKFKSYLDQMVARYGTADESQLAPGLGGGAPSGGSMYGAGGAARRSWLPLLAGLLGLPLAALALYGLWSASQEPRTGLTSRPAPSGLGFTKQMNWALGAGAPPAPPAGANGAERVIGGNFRIVREMGRGGMGLVYEAVDEALQRKVALKKMREEIRDSQRDRERFLQEARMVAALKHPNIVAIHTILEEEGEVYLVFEYMAGRSLDKVLDERRVLPLAEVKKIMHDVCEALAYAHEHKIVHRDLKPSNIIFDEEGRAKVMDFGIARQAKETVSKMSRTEAWGTPAYMAPEQELGEVGRESDVYALGVMLFEMLTGDVPFRGPNFLAQKSQRLHKPPSQVNPSLPPEVDAVVAKALDPDPKQRYRTARELSAALAGAGARAAA